MFVVCSPFAFYFYFHVAKTRTDVIEHIIDLYSIEFRENEPTPTSNSVPSTSLVSSLLSKHIQTHTNSSSTLTEEIYRFQNSICSDDNILIFWKKNSPEYPKLAAIARVILAIPMTTSKSEGSFSTAGCLIRKQRASITPYRAEKTLFIHDNYDLLKMK